MSQQHFLTESLRTCSFYIFGITVDLSLSFVTSLHVSAHMTLSPYLSMIPLSISLDFFLIFHTFFLLYEIYPCTDYNIGECKYILYILRTLNAPCSKFLNGMNGISFPSLLKI